MVQTCLLVSLVHLFVEVTQSVDLAECLPIPYKQVKPTMRAVPLGLMRTSVKRLCLYLSYLMSSVARSYHVVVFQAASLGCCRALPQASSLFSGSYHPATPRLLGGEARPQNDDVIWMKSFREKHFGNGSTIDKICAREHFFVTWEHRRMNSLDPPVNTRGTALDWLGKWGCREWADARAVPGYKIICGSAHSIYTGY